MWKATLTFPTAIASFSRSIALNPNYLASPRSLKGTNSRSMSKLTLKNQYSNISNLLFNSDGPEEINVQGEEADA